MRGISSLLTILVSPLGRKGSSTQATSLWMMDGCQRESLNQGST